MSNNFSRWTFIARNQTHATVECKQCGLLRDIWLSSLTPNMHIVCENCGA